MTYRTSWNPASGEPFKNAIAELPEQHQLDFGLAAADRYFEVTYGTPTPAIEVFPKKHSLAAFLMRFLANLQSLGTVTAIDYAEYSKLLTGSPK